MFGASAVTAGPGVGGVLSVPRGRAVPGPVKLLRLVLSEQADGLLLEAAVELIYGRGSGSGSENIQGINPNHLLILTLPHKLK